MELTESTLYLLVAIDKNGFYEGLFEKIKTDKALSNSIKSLAQRINRLNASKFDQEYVDSLRDEELLALVRVLTKLDGNTQGFSFGSVSPVPSLIEVLQSRGYKDYEGLVDWVFKNKTNEYLPFGSFYLSHAGSLKEYQLLIEEDRLKRERIQVEAEIRRVEKQREYYPKATQDLRNAIRRGDWMAFDTLVRKGAEIYTLDENGKTLAENMAEVRRAEIKSSSLSRMKIEQSLYLCDVNNHALTIKVSDITPTDNDLDKFDCVSMTARYDNGFGFSQLYRFVDDKESQEIKDRCDEVRSEGQSKLLPMTSSGRWWVIVTPIVKGNTDSERQICKKIMGEIFTLSQQPSVSATKLFISQYRHMLSYRDKQFEGTFEALKALKASSFGELNEIYFEVDTRHKHQFYKQLRSTFIK